MRRRVAPYFLLGPGAAWLLLFFVVPLYYLGELSLNSGVFGSYEFSWHWANYSDALRLYDTQFVRSFLYAVVAPFFTTYLIRPLAWETILSDQSPVVSVLDALGLAPEGHVLATAGAVIAGLTYNFLPFMVLPIYASLERLDVRLIEAGKDLYASATQTFFRVTLPLSAPGVVAGTLLTFIPASGDYVNAQFLGSANNQMIGNVIQSLYLKQSDYPAAAALSFVLMALILILVLVYIRFAGSEALMGEEAAG